jgi:hypothetical protein
MLSRTHFLTEFDLHLVDLTFVPRVHNAKRMGLRGIDESLFPIIAPRLLDEVLGELQGPITRDQSFKDRGFGRNWDIFG